MPIISSRDKGLNKITVTIDADNKVDEMSESNNSITKEFYIYEGEAYPMPNAGNNVIDWSRPYC